MSLTIHPNAQRFIVPRYTDANVLNPGSATPLRPHRSPAVMFVLWGHDDLRPANESLLPSSFLTWDAVTDFRGKGGNTRSKVNSGPTGHS
ncbi:hypothetical protein DPEC_G00050030 [Dallia pectoralis]|uniref:Uncharacterized protein n=1 Tax=Dallia pectoralis TaxID=75939 RepID=A0ACC2HAV0_DALPE|nr:hypothetical protein DPEC_G00050030 [Dallia pectoralis]